MPKKKTTATKKAATAKKTATKKKATTTAKRSNSTNKKKRIGSIKHKDKRVNIPTEELRDFVSEDENTPQKMLYPRDPSLDPQLMWKGKDEQDSQDLEVPIVPIYIQEKIHPQVIIEHLKTRTKQDEDQIGLFEDFNGIVDFEKKIDFYHHESNWTNRMILGDSLLVMNSLAEKEGLKGKVQTIYIDPPYGIKFSSNWQVSTRSRDIKDSRSADVTRQPEQVRAYRDTWVMGIHSYLAYLRDRLVVSYRLLTETGSVFVQIGDENSHLVRCLLDEIFGADNFIATINFRTTAGRGAKYIDKVNDCLLWYGKNIELTKYRQLFTETSLETRNNYDWLEKPDLDRIQLSKEQRLGLNPIPEGRQYALTDLTSQGETNSGRYIFPFEGEEYRARAGRHWSTTESGMSKLVNADRIQVKGKNVFFRRFLNDYPVRALDNNWNDTAMGGFLKSEDKVYVVQTPVKVIERCILMSTDPGDIVLDPTCGGGTTAYVSEQLGRRWITIDTSRVAMTLARTRTLSAKYPYYLLADSANGIVKEAEITGKVPPPHETDNDIRKGFVYKRVPHVTLRSIANNPEIVEELPREDIDATIKRHSDQELLFDQPYEDNKKVRVTGPFTVESLSPHRVLATDDRASESEEDARSDASNNFGNIIIENLRKAGVQNTVKNERLKFDWLDPFAGSWVHATGEFTDKDGKTKRIAVSIGPEHGTVSPQHVKEAAKEAVQGVGYDVLIVCGFAFDPHVSEEAKRYGQLTVLPTRMNPDLAMGDELLKKTGAGNLFMIFGEPDLKVTKEKNGNISVELLGVDVYDPTTGEIRNSSTDDIACWFIDTEYNGESFFVRHAYFTGGDKPYEKLKKALKAEINEEAWEALYSTTSRPFPKPETGKIAIKVINHYGDEVLKVYEV